MQDDEIPLPLKLQSGGGVYGVAIRVIIFVIIQSIVLLGVASLLVLGLKDKLPIFGDHESPLTEVADYYLSVFTSAFFSAFEIFSDSQSYSLRIGFSIAVIVSIGLVNAGIHEKIFHKEKYGIVIIKSSAAIGYPRAVNFTHFIDLLGQMITTMWSSKIWDDEHWEDYLDLAQKYANDAGLDFDVKEFCRSFRDDPVPLVLVLLGHYKTVLTVTLFVAPFVIWVVDISTI